MHESALEIKDRLLKMAIRTWNLPEVEAESVMDPLVSMLFSACALELSNIASEINETQTRLTERLIEIMSPNIQQGVLPSHALAYTNPTESELTLYTSDFLYSSKELNKNRKTKKINFSPTRETKLINGQVEYILHSDDLIRFDKNLVRFQTLSGQKKNMPSPNELWIGLNISPSITELQNISFYFDFKGVNFRKLFFYLLKNTEWSIDDKKLITHSGIKKQQESALYDILAEKSNTHRTLLTHIENFYSERFINVDLTDVSLIRQTPEALKEIINQFPEENKNGFEKILWLKIDFPRNIPTSILQELNCYINVFPVANLSLENKIFRSRKHLNIFAINDDDLFFDIELIENADGKVYNQSKVEKITDIEDNQYVIRGEGVESYDSRLASEHITHLIEKLKNEGAAFNFLDTSSFNNDLVVLHQIVSKLEINLDKLPQFSSKVYLFLKANTDNLAIHVNYWSTMGELTNNIKPRTSLSIFQSGSILQGNSFLITAPIGGRSKMTRADRLNNYRSSLLYRDKIITNEDIIAFCRFYLGSRFIRMNIEKGITKEFSSKEGFIRTIDLHIELDNSENKSNESVLLLCKDMMITLEEKATSVFPFRFFINKQHIDV